MNDQNQNQNNSNVQTGSGSSSTLDPQVQALTESIQQQESGGNYQDVGDSGTSLGAYQWQPETWQAESTKYLGSDAPQSPLDATPQQQNQVAYDQVNSWKNQGLTPPQIASLWNSGDPNAYTGQFSNGTPSVGYNSQIGENYDVPSYVSNVKNNFDALTSGGQMSTGKGGSTTPDTSKMSTFEKVLLGIGGTAGLAGLTIATGGLDLPAVLSAAGTVGSLADAGALGEAGATVATAGTNTGLLSSGLAAAKGLGTTAGILDLAKNAIFGNKASNNATEQAADTTAQGEQQAGQEEAQATEQAAQSEDEQNETDTDITNAQQKSAQLEQDIQNQMQQTQQGRRAMQTPEYQGGANAIGQNGYAPENVGGFVNTSKAQSQASNDLQSLDEMQNDGLEASGLSAPIESLRQKAYARIDEDASIPAVEKKEAKSAVDEFVQQHSETLDPNGTGSLPLGRRGHTEARNFGYSGYDTNSSKAKNKAKRHFGGAANDLIKESLPKEHAELYEKTNKKKKDIIYAKKILAHLDGKKAGKNEDSLGHKLLKAGGNAFAAYIGAKIGGPVGAAVGEHFGEKIVNAIDKRLGKRFFESPAGQSALKSASKGNKKLEKKFAKITKQYGVKNPSDEIKGNNFTMKSPKGESRPKTEPKTNEGMVPKKGTSKGGGNLSQKKKQKGMIKETKPKDETPTAASIPVMITRQMRSDLEKNGFSKEEISKMKPSEAHEKIKRSNPK